MLKVDNIEKAYTYLESGPVVLVTAKEKSKNYVMAISWHMLMDFTPRIAMCSGSWNETFEAIIKAKECVIAIPSVSMIEKVIGIGTNHGSEVDKYKEYKLKTSKGKIVKAPLLEECVACIECKLEEYQASNDLLIFSGEKLWVNKGKREKRVVHAIGDGTFVVDGEKLDFRKEMQNRLP